MSKKSKDIPLKNKIIELYKDKTKIIDISKQLNCSIYSIQKMVKLAGIYKRQQGKLTWSDVDVNWLIEHYSELGPKKCGKILNKSKSSCLHQANKSNLKISSACRSELLSENSQLRFKSKIINSLFETCSIPEVAYILGFLWGDGYISRGHGYNIRTKITSDDAKSLLPIFNSTGEWDTYKYQPKGKNDREQTIISTNNKSLFMLLSDLDFIDKYKKSPTKVLEFIPDKFKCYFWRGLADADGCIYVLPTNYSESYFSITSNYNQEWKFAENTFLGGKIIRQKFSNGGNSRFEVSTRNNMMIALNYIYGGKLFGLDRKYQKYLMLYNVYSKKYNQINPDLVPNL